MKKTTHNKLLYLIIVLSIIGLSTSIYLVIDHYSTEGSVCDINSTISCSLVNTSVFSEILNAPVAIFGALWFVILIALSWRALKENGVIHSSLLGWNIFGILFVIYLISAEIILGALCLFCTLVHVIIMITFILSFILYKTQKVKPSWKKVIQDSKKWIAVIIILNLIPLVIFNFPAGEKENYDELAKCMTESGIKMYGSFRCGVCAKTRSMFDDSFRFITEVECHPQGENPQTELCLAKNIKNTPTWILEPNGIEQKRQEGFMSIEKLREFSGCTI